MSSQQKVALKVAAILWVVWGIVHVFAGGIVIASSATGGFQAIADAINPALLEANYHPAAGGILNQHGWNLLWGGAVTIIGAVFIWKQSLTAIWVTALVGGLLDIGYFVFVDLPGFVNFVPGTVMTLVSATAIILSFWVWGRSRNNSSGTGSLPEVSSQPTS